MSLLSFSSSDLTRCEASAADDVGADVVVPVVADADVDEDVAATGPPAADAVAIVAGVGVWAGGWVVAPTAPVVVLLERARVDALIDD